MINQDVLNELKIPVKIYFWDEIGLKWTIGSEDVESDRQKNKHQRIEKKCSKLGLMWRKPQTRVKTDGL